MQLSSHQHHYFLNPALREKANILLDHSRLSKRQETMIPLRLYYTPERPTEILGEMGGKVHPLRIANAEKC